MPTIKVKEAHGFERNKVQGMWEGLKERKWRGKKNYKKI